MNDKHIGILYSTATGIILRTVNPDPMMGDVHLNWLDEHKPEGTTLLRIEKALIHADEHKCDGGNCPNLDFLIPYIKSIHSLDLKFGMNCGIVDSNNNVVRIVIACPVLHQIKLNKDAEEFNLNRHPSLPEAIPHQCIAHPSLNVGDTYDLVAKIHTQSTRKQK